MGVDGLLSSPLADRGNCNIECGSPSSTHDTTSTRKRSRPTLSKPTPPTASTDPVEVFPIFSLLREHADAFALVFAALVGRGIGQELDPCTLSLAAVSSTWHRVFNSRSVWWNAPRLLPTLGSVNWSNLRLARALRIRGTEGLCYRCVERSTGRELAVRLLCDPESRRSIGANQQQLQSSSSTSSSSGNSAGVPYFALRALAALPQRSECRSRDLNAAGSAAVDDSESMTLHLSTPLTVSLHHGVLVMFYDFCSSTLHDLMHDQSIIMNSNQMVSQAVALPADDSTSTSAAAAAEASLEAAKVASENISASGPTRTKRVPLPRAWTKEILRQALLGLRSLHRRGVMHRNVKPKHFLVHTFATPQSSSEAPSDVAPAGAGGDATPSADGKAVAEQDDPISRSPETIRVRLADFSLSRFSAAPAHASTPNLVSRWYRAPELLLGQDSYGPAVDIWSIGCIFAEMALGRVLFRGRSEIDQLFQIFSLLGTPKHDTWAGFHVLPHANQGETFPHWPRSRLADLFASSSSSPTLPETTAEKSSRFGSSSGCDSSSGVVKGESMESLEAGDEEEKVDDSDDDKTPKFGLCHDGIDLLTSLLSCDPAQRPTADQALDHPYFTTSAAPPPAAAMHEQKDPAQGAARAATNQQDHASCCSTNSREAWAAPRLSSEEALDHLAILLRLEEEGGGNDDYGDYTEGGRSISMDDADHREAHLQLSASSLPPIPARNMAPKELLVGLEFAFEVAVAFELRMQTAFRAGDLLHRWHDADAAVARNIGAENVSSVRAAMLRAAACVLVASKIDDVQFIAVDDLVTSAGELFGPCELVLSEETLLKALAFDIHRPSAPDALSTLVAAVQEPAVVGTRGVVIPMGAIHLASFVLECGLLFGNIRDFKAVSRATSKLYARDATCSHDSSTGSKDSSASTRTNNSAVAPTAGSTRNVFSLGHETGCLTPTLAAAGALAYALTILAATFGSQRSVVTHNGIEEQASSFGPLDARAAISAIVSSLSRAADRNDREGGIANATASSFKRCCTVSMLGFIRAGEISSAIHACSSSVDLTSTIAQRQRLYEERGNAAANMAPREVKIPWPWTTQ